jgi:hypothetical protein
LHKLFFADSAVAVFVVAFDHPLNAFAVLLVGVVGGNFAVLIAVDAIEHRFGIGTTTLGARSTAFATGRATFSGRRPVRTGTTAFATRTTLWPTFARPAILPALAHLAMVLHEFFFCHRAIAIRIHAFEHFFGIKAATRARRRASRAFARRRTGGAVGQRQFKLFGRQRAVFV